MSGGHGVMFDYRQSPELQKKITEFNDAGKLLASVCHGTGAFTDSKDGKGNLIIKGRRLTGYSTLEERLGSSYSAMPYLLEPEFAKNGAIYKKAWIPFTNHVEEDGNLITGQNPQSARGVAKAVLNYLKKK